jgi:hypothetical protein
MNIKISVQHDAEYLIIFIRSGKNFQFCFIRELFQLQSVMPRLTVMNKCYLTLLKSIDENLHKPAPLFTVVE